MTRACDWCPHCDLTDPKHRHVHQQPILGPNGEPIKVACPALRYEFGTMTKFGTWRRETFAALFERTRS